MNPIPQHVWLNVRAPERNEKNKRGRINRCMKMTNDVYATVVKTEEVKEIKQQIHYRRGAKRSGGLLRNHETVQFTKTWTWSIEPPC